ncbi:hypothetical protein Tco_1006341 [Tanacetum coccineum]|uniref:DUF4218 domain-containing protein n=1 Tax=Tanacetum coccineum TaxID=301880 RepID=A0ABQ5FIT2_9ASTR
MPNCPICKASRWKDPKKTKGKKVANNGRAFTFVTPDYKRMFNTKHIAKWMTWHATRQSNENGKMNQPCDGREWKHFDMMKPEFSGDPRNPLIKELQELWKGVWTKDVATGTHFQVKATVLWTINDFPARSSLSGWSGQGYYACPTCNEDTPSMAVKRKSFMLLCARSLMQQDMAKAKKQLISMMINLEQIFPPDFFDIMIHLVIHLPDEAIQGGPLRYRWMFPFERYMKKLKNYVRNKAKPEGSIAEGYVAEEALTFCSRYLKDVETRFNRPGRNDDGLPEQPDKFQVFQSVCKPTGRMKETRMTTDVMQAVVWFVLNNSPEVDADILAYQRMACVAPRSHGGDAGGSPPRRPIRPVPAQCQSSMLRLETGNRSLRKAFRENNEQPLKIGFDYEDLGTFHPLGNFSGMLNSLMGETVRHFPLLASGKDISRVDKGYYEDLIETWRKGHSNKKTGQFKTTEKLDMKAMKDNIKAGLIPFKTDQEILDEIVSSDNRQNMSAWAGKLPGGGSTSRRRANRAFGDIMTSGSDHVDVQATRARERVTQEAS